MNRASKFRALFSFAILLGAAIIVIAREHRPSFLRPGLRFYAYVSTADNSVSVVDLVKLATVAHVPIGGPVSAMREHPTRAEVWGVSSNGGFALGFDLRTSQVAAPLPPGALPHFIDFFPAGRRAYIPPPCRHSPFMIDFVTSHVI